MFYNLGFFFVILFMASKLSTLQDDLSLSHLDWSLQVKKIGDEMKRIGDESRQEKRNEPRGSKYLSWVLSTSRRAS